MTELLPWLGTGTLGYENYAADSWGQGQSFILDAVEAAKGRRKPRRLSSAVRRRISNGPKALGTVNTAMGELCIPNKQREIKGRNRRKGERA